MIVREHIIVALSERIDSKMQWLKNYVKKEGATDRVKQEVADDIRTLSSARMYIEMLPLEVEAIRQVRETHKNKADGVTLLVPFKLDAKTENFVTVDLTKQKGGANGIRF